MYSSFIRRLCVNWERKKVFYENSCISKHFQTQVKPCQTVTVSAKHIDFGVVFFCFLLFVFLVFVCVWGEGGGGGGCQEESLWL